MARHETPDQLETRAGRIVDVLRQTYADVRVALSHETPLQLLVATILSAQCTDARVNMVTPALFARYRTAREFAAAEPSELEAIIRSTGFFRSKAKNIIGCCRAIQEQFAGEVPRRLEDLVTLPGVGRKTANVVLGACWGIPGVVVDTHVKRIARLLGLTRHTDPEKIERDLMTLLPAAAWNDLSLQLIHHGRRTCIARRPRCPECPLHHLCPSVTKIR